MNNPTPTLLQDGGYIRTTWTSKAIQEFCIRTNRNMPHSTDMELYYFKYYAEELKAIEAELKNATLEELI